MMKWILLATIVLVFIYNGYMITRGVIQKNPSDKAVLGGIHRLWILSTCVIAFVAVCIGM